MNTLSKRRLLLLALLLVLAFLPIFNGCERGARVEDAARTSDSLRIISTAPSITETLFALGLDDEVVAVSDYCKYPERAKELPKIGSLYEYNVEKIVELEPDYVVVLKENEILPPRLAKLGIEVVKVDHTSLEGVFDSFESLGKLFEHGALRGGVLRRAVGAHDRGLALRREQESRLESIRARTSKLTKPRVLVSIYRTLGTGKISEAYIAGANPFFNSALEIAGGVNVGRDLPGVAPTTNAEGVVSLNPDVILDLSTDGIERDAAARERDGALRSADWEALGSEVVAVRDGRVYQIFDDYATVPGPRAILFIEDLARLLHPELEPSVEQ